MKEVTSLPDDVVAAGQLFMVRHKSILRAYILPIFVFFVLPENITLEASLLVAAIYLFIIFGSHLSHILWKFEKGQWCKYYLSLILGVATAIFCKLYNLNHWLIHEVGYVPDGDVTPYFVVISFVPLVAAYFDSGVAVERAFYKSKGFNFIGWPGSIRGL